MAVVLHDVEKSPGFEIGADSEAYRHDYGREWAMGAAEEPAAY